jgi:hypothetical protein
MFSIFVQPSNLYHSHNTNTFKTSPKSLKWDIIMDKMKGHVKRNRPGDYWRTNLMTETPVVGKLMS